MTIKDILDTPISDMLEAISPFLIGYFIFFGLVFLIVLLGSIFVFVQVVKGNREFNKRAKKHKSLIRN